MQKNIFKNILAGFFVAFLAFSPLLVKVESAHAQTGGFSTSGGFTYGSGLSGGLDAYIKGLAPAITQLPLCKEKISSGIKTLFRKTKGVLAPDQLGLSGQEGSLGSQFGFGGSFGSSGGAGLGIGGEAIIVADPESRKEIQELKSEVEDVKESTQSTNEAETCLDSIGRLVVKMLLQKVTVSTVTWIQSGFEGSPAFLQDPGRFFGDIARNEILEFGLEISDETKYPFGKAFMYAQAQAFNRKFADNAQYSLDELIANTTPEFSGVSFKGDFGFGGWDAWDYLTQVPANNALGFSLMAELEVSKRLEGTVESAAEEIKRGLSEAGGYLGDLRCANPENLTREAHEAALEAGNLNGTCKRWEYVTPGAMIAQAATRIVDYPDNNILKAEDLNDAVAAILDALIYRFHTDLLNKGFADFSDQGSDGLLVINQYATDGNYVVSQVDQDFPPSLQGSNWLTSHKNFNIRTDITQAIIDEQRTYIQKLEEQNDVIVDLIRAIRQLDYCIPGPNPDWERSSSVDEFYTSIKLSPSKYQDPPIPFSAFDPTGIFSGIAQAILDSQKEKDIKRNIAHYIENLLDVGIYDGQDQVLNERGIRSLLENSFESYRQLIYDTYFAGSKSHAYDVMPLVTSEARSEFFRIPGYEGITDRNDEEIAFKKSVVVRLAQIKDVIDSLNQTMDTQSQDYEDEIAKWIPYFARLTNDMVTGNDVARVDNLLNDLKNRFLYVQEDLLWGPGGCEAEMEFHFDNNKDAYLQYARRQPYGIQIDYLYGTATSIDGPYAQVPWDEDVIQTWDPDEGFMYGAVFWNFWARPYDGGAPKDSDGNPNPPNLNAIAANSCPEFIGVVELSLPGPDGSDPDIKDIGGLNPGGDPPGQRENVCGIITRRFEKIFNIY